MDFRADIQTQLTSLLKSFTGDPDIDKEPALAKLDTLSDRVRGLKRKLDDLQPSPGAPSALRDRIAYVEDTLLPSNANESMAITEPSTETDEPKDKKDGVRNGNGVENGNGADEKRATRRLSVPPKPPV